MDNYTEPSYTPPVYEQPIMDQQPPEAYKEEPMTMGEWIVSFLLLMIPCANLVLPFVWAFSKTEKKSKSNFFKAYLIMMAVLVGLYLLIGIVVAVIMVGMAASY